MGETHDFTNLDWLQSDIEQSLQQAQQTLESYLNEKDPAHLQASYDALHQVKGSLQMAGVATAVMLAEQLEELALQLLKGSVSDFEAASNALAQGLVFMPAYLHKLKKREDTPPALLHTVINDIRQVLGQSSIDELDLFDPDLGQPPEKASPAVKTQFDQLGVGELRKLRQAYQFALIGLIRKEDVKVNMARLANVLARLERLCQDAPIHPLWDIAGAFVESLIVGGSPLHNASYNLLRSLEREIKAFIEAGVFALDTPADPAILRQMLYYIAKSSEAGPHVQAVRQTYDLARYQLGDVYARQPFFVAGPDPETFKTVAAVLGEEVERVKDTIDLYVRNPHKRAADLEHLLPSLRQIASTLVMLNLEGPRLVIQEEANRFAEQLRSEEKVSDSQLQQIAEALLYLEDELQSLTDSASSASQETHGVLVGAASDVVIAECLKNTQKAREFLHTFLLDDCRFDLIEPVPDTLRGVYGGLSMLSMPTVAQLVLSISQYVEDDMLAQQRVPEPQALDALAEVMATIELVLEGLVAERSVDEAVLTRAKAQIAQLGYPVEQFAGISSERDETAAAYNAEAEAENETPVEAQAPVTLFAPEPSDETCSDLAGEDSGSAGKVDDVDAIAQTDSAYLAQSDIEAQAGEEEQSAAAGVSGVAAGEERVIAPDGLAPVSVAQPLQSEDEEDLVDEEILEIFSEEALEVFAEINTHWPVFSSDFNNSTALTETRRAFHTLKGSGRMVQAEFISELAWAVENLLNRVIDGEVQPGNALCDLVDEIRQALPSLLAHFQAQTIPDLDIAAWIGRADRLATGEAEKVEPESDALLSDTSKSASGSVVSAGLSMDEPDSLIYELFVKESEQHLLTLAEFLQSAQDGIETGLTEELYRALHTLKGSAKMAGLENFAEIVSPLELLVLTNINLEHSVDEDLLQLLQQGLELMTQAQAQLPANPDAPIAGRAAFIADVQARQIEINATVAAADIAPLSESQAFIRNHVETICSLTELYESWRETGALDSPLLPQIQDNIGQLLAAQPALGMSQVPALLTALAETLTALHQHQVMPEPALLTAMDAVHEGLISVFDQVAASDVVNDCSECIDQLYWRLSEAQAPAEAMPDDAKPEDMPEREETHQAPTEPAEEDAPDNELIEIFLEEADEILEQASVAKQRWIENSDDNAALDELQRCLHTLKGGARMSGITSVGDLSHELESLYEAVAKGELAVSAPLYELVHVCDDRITDMLAELRTRQVCQAAPELIENLQRFRSQALVAPAEQSAVQPVAGFVESGAALLAQLESTIGAAREAHADYPMLHEQLCQTLTALQEAAYQAECNEAGDLSHIFLEVLAGTEPETLAQEAVQSDLADWLERIALAHREACQAQGEDPQAPAVNKAEAVEAPAERKSGQDNVRVSAALLEHLVDLAGETSVTRSRVEQQVSNYSYALDEVGATIARLREQLRRMENETETQILFRQEQEGPNHEGFDPLEMDRYSRMQELSRALLESVSDLLDLKETLRERVRITENLLLQQSRTNTELNEGLMKARMVPFSRLVPRLRRITRQISRELGKSVDLQFAHAETELDRALLEHMTAPLEHMLRNALDHGIEPVWQRAAAGKPAAGQVGLDLRRDGAEIVLTLRDDGAGIDIDRVRDKAIERGLMAADAKLTDHEILQFILQPGFTTAEQVTQISGRGVGMDVVNSEIRQMGGSISIESQVGVGSCFSVRVPFTVSISRALMVNVGEEQFALPLSAIEGVVRVNPYELEEYYRDDGPDFEYAGIKYDLHYLGDFLGRDQAHQVQSGLMPLPVVLVRTSEHAIAVQVDTISGSREVVVKPLGPQLANVPGMSGATILGDGRVVLILDMGAMIREHLATEGFAAQESDQTEAAKEVRERLRVMVVDDSVTVRKVASRLLERHGMEVILAKDGVEAMTRLQDVRPDIMLLDIEMPRMDGFELASLVRHDEVLRDVPVIMISSRTGNKHRARAQEIGVNQFMGKPFQEADLLQAIEELTGRAPECLSA